MNRHLVLVGLPGSGKSSVGLLVAEMLDVRSYDIDELVAANEGCSVADLIKNRGESEFRELERSETNRVLEEPPAVVIPGGGWAAEGNNLSDLTGRALSVYLETSAQTAAARLSGSVDRPLLAGSDPLARMTQLLETRQSFYERCDATVSTEGKAVREVALEVVELARGAK